MTSRDSTTRAKEKAVIEAAVKWAKEVEGQRPYMTDDYWLDAVLYDPRPHHQTTQTKGQAMTSVERDNLLHIGCRMATACFNVSQVAWKLTDDDRDVMRELSFEWDAAVRALRTTKPQAKRKQRSKRR